MGHKNEIRFQKLKAICGNQRIAGLSLPAHLKGVEELIAAKKGGLTILKL